MRSSWKEDVETEEEESKEEQIPRGINFGYL